MADATVTASVIIPVYNDPDGVRTTVESVLDQTVDDYEVIIADNGSTDQTRLFGKQYATRDRVKRVVEDDIQGSYAARNAGIEVAEGNLLCFIDADMWVESDWLESIQTRMQDEDIDYLGCNVEIVVENETVFAEYNRQTGFDVRHYIEDRNFAPTCCLVVRRNVIEDVGAFDERLISSGDVEFGKRVARGGYSQVFAEDITMYHPARETLTALLKKEYRISRGRIQRAKYHPDVFECEHSLHPFNFLPVKPTAARDAFRENEVFDSFLQFYIYITLKKITKSVGHTREWLRQGRP